MFQKLRVLKGPSKNNCSFFAWSFTAAPRWSSSGLRLWSAFNRLCRRVAVRPPVSICRKVRRRKRTSTYFWTSPKYIFLLLALFNLAGTKSLGNEAFKATLKSTEDAIKAVQDIQMKSNEKTSGRSPAVGEEEITAGQIQKELEEEMKNAQKQLPPKTTNDSDPNLQNNTSTSPSKNSGSQEVTPPPGSPDGLAQPAAGKDLLNGIIEDFDYEVSGRRDPFLPYTSPKAVIVEEEDEVVSPLQRFDLDQLRLTGIIWDTKKPKAMFLDPQGKGYIVGKLDKVGRNRGHIAEIREGEVIVLERFVGEGRSTFQTRSIRLERE